MLLGIIFCSTLVNCLMKFNKGKYKVQHVSQGNPKHKYRLGREGIESAPEKKDLGMFEDEKVDTICQYELAAQKAKHIKSKEVYLAC